MQVTVAIMAQMCEIAPRRAGAGIGRQTRRDIAKWETC